MNSQYIIHYLIELASPLLSNCVQTATSFWRCIGDVSRIPPPFQPNPIARNVSGIAAFIASPPVSPATSVFIANDPVISRGWLRNWQPRVETRSSCGLIRGPQIVAIQFHVTKTDWRFSFLLGIVGLAAAGLFFHAGSSSSCSRAIDTAYPMLSSAAKAKDVDYAPSFHWSFFTHGIFEVVHRS